MVAVFMSRPLRIDEARHSPVMWALAVMIDCSRVACEWPVRLGPGWTMKNGVRAPSPGLTSASSSRSAQTTTIMRMCLYARV